MQLEDLKQEGTKAHHQGASQRRPQIVPRHFGLVVSWKSGAVVPTRTAKIQEVRSHTVANHVITQPLALAFEDAGGQSWDVSPLLPKTGTDSASSRLGLLNLWRDL
jgi:hypothetical protein